MNFIEDLSLECIVLCEVVFFLFFFLTTKLSELILTKLFHSLNIVLTINDIYDMILLTPELPRTEA